jgi:adhesin transport system membrane fusion protein
MGALVRRSSSWAEARRTDRELAGFLTGAAGAESLRPRALSHIILIAVVAFFTAFVVWARYATLDEVTRGEGKVIPSTQVQVIQNLEGGIVAALLVHEGEVVEKDQPLMRIENVRAESDYKQQRARYLAVEAAIARLDAEIDDTAIHFPPEVLAEAKGLADSEMQLFTSREAALQDQLAILKQQSTQRQQDVKELQSKIEITQRSLQLAKEQLQISQPLAAQHIVPKTEMLQLERQVNDLQGQLDQAQLTVPRAQAALQEASERIASAYSSFRAEALKDLNDRRAERAGLKEALAAGRDRVRRTEVLSPVRGTIKQIKVTTIGGVIQPGQDLMEIVPLDDTLLIEARVRPADIAFIHPGQPANVKITAYDYSIYGGLDGKVEDISADTIANEKGESFYRVRVRTVRNHLGTDKKPLAIIPGMTAQIDILTGHKSVLDYILKPILKAREEALKER